MSPKKWTVWIASKCSWAWQSSLLILLIMHFVEWDFSPWWKTSSNFWSTNLKLKYWGYHPNNIRSKLCEMTGETPESQTLFVLLLERERIGHNAECVNNHCYHGNSPSLNEIVPNGSRLQNLATSITIIIDIQWSRENKLWKKFNC